MSNDFSTAYPNSRKAFVEGPQGVRVPMREVALSKGEPSIRLYDTSGPQDHDVTNGLPKLREPWVQARRAASKAGQAVTQLHYARKGEITPGDGVHRRSARGCPPTSCATRWRAAARSSRRTSTTSSSSR